MREAKCGVYGWDFVIYLAELMIFGIAGLTIGLVVRKPFIGVNRFVEGDMEMTGVLCFDEKKNNILFIYRQFLLRNCTFPFRK